MHPGYKRTLIALLLFGVAFGYVEAAVVSYLRPLFEPVRHRYYPLRSPDELFPLLTFDEVGAAGHEYFRLVEIEQGREVATLGMLAAVAIAVGRGSGQSFAAFLIVFGVWDISFYAFLKLLIHWPASLLTSDVLFLLPVPWVAPVVAPLLVSLSMIGVGLLYLVLDWRGGPVRLSLLNRLGILVGAVIVIASFTRDFRNVSAGGMPHPFNWPLFALGETISLAAFVFAPWSVNARR